jgi:hypothetical protein
VLKLFRKSQSDKAPADGLFTIRENRLCAELGISVDELRRRRQLFRLQEGVHFAYVKKRVMLSEVGALVLRGTIGLKIPAHFEGEPATANSERTPGTVAGLLLEKNPPPIEFTGKLIAWAAPVSNPRLLIAYLPGTDPSNPLNLVTVMVRSNTNFLQGMELPGPGRVINQLRDNHFELQGACPRWRGRW